MDYPHLITIKRPANAGVDPTPGDQDEDTGLWEGDTDPSDDYTTVWKGRCDCQDKGEVILRDSSGAPTLESDAVCFLSNQRAVTWVVPNNIVTITWEDETEQDARVLQVRRLDGSLLLQRL